MQNLGQSPKKMSSSKFHQKSPFDFYTLEQLTQHNSPIFVSLTKPEKRCNRYQNVIPYEYNCVRLKDNTYVNASKMFLEEKPSSRYIIAAQAPNLPGIASFLKMLIEKGVRYVFTIGDVKLGVMEKYWPDKNSTIEQQGIRIHNEDEEKFGEGIIRRNLTLTFKGEVFRFQQFHLYLWQDKTAPPEQYRQSLIKLVQFSREEIKLERRLLVHCSAGVGRTGVVLGMIILSMKSIHHRQASAEQQVFNAVRHLRRHRYGMIQIPQQYQFLISFQKVAIRKEKGKMQFSRNVKNSLLKSKSETNTLYTVTVQHPLDFYLEYREFWERVIQFNFLKILIQAILDDHNQLKVELSFSHNRSGNVEKIIGVCNPNNSSISIGTSKYQLKSSFLKILIQPKQIFIGEGDIILNKNECTFNQPFQSMFPVLIRNYKGQKRIKRNILSLNLKVLKWGN